jgi:hypothetical protein
VANSRFSDGIVNGGATETLLERNTANENGRDGIESGGRDDMTITPPTSITTRHRAMLEVIDGAEIGPW